MKTLFTQLTLVSVLMSAPTLDTLAASIDSTDKYAWGTNVGWFNFNTTQGSVTVYEDHLEGYAWTENVGWLKLGSYTGGGSHTYANTSETDWGINHNGSGQLTGYAWNAQAGWINFSPAQGDGVTIDPSTGVFSGYAWGENVGWIHFSQTAPVAYQVRLSQKLSLPTVTLSVSQSNGTEEGETVITVTATASQAVVGDQTVDLSITGVAASDYTLSGTTFTLADGQTEHSLTFTVVDDDEVEDTETATLSLTNPSDGIVLGDTNSQTITITDNDSQKPPVPTVTLSVNQSNGTEEGETMITVTATASQAVVGDQTVDLSITGVAASDYTLSGTTFTLADGQTQHSLTFTVVDDDETEDTETATLSLTNPSDGVVLGDMTSQTITITDNDEQVSACRQLYGVHDQGLNDSQFFASSSDDPSIKALGEMHTGFDIEAVDLHPITQELYAASGDDTTQKGYLYLVDKEKGQLLDQIDIQIADQTVEEIDGLSFHPKTGELWAWAQDVGLIKIQTDKVTEDGQEKLTVTAKLMVAYQGEIEDLAWSADGESLYGVQNRHDLADPDAAADLGGVRLLSYSSTDGTVKTLCEELTTEAPEIEALESLSNGHLIFAFHSRKALLVGTIDPSTCEIKQVETLETPYNDIEGLACEQ